MRVPASSANLGPGFDSVGLALGIFDEVEATVSGTQLVITVDGHGAGEVPMDEGHLVWRSACSMWQYLDVDPPRGLILHCHNEIAHSRGVGSSAAAIVVGLAVGLALVRDGIDDAWSLTLINQLASDIEGHPDNASASVYGGCTLSWADDHGGGWRTVRPLLHSQIRPIVFVPAATLSTEKARAVLGETVGLSVAASTAGRSALLIEAITRDPTLLLPATRDWLHQEARRSAYSYSMELVEWLREDGYAAAISGAGPAVLVLGTDENVAQIVGLGKEWRVLTPGVPDTGVRIVSRSVRYTV